MTAKAGALAISVSGTPAAQNVVAGTQDFVFANLQFDATASGENVRLSSILASFTNGGTASYITGCQLYDGSKALNTGSNVIDSVSAGSNTFTLDSPLTIEKETVKTIALACDISSSATTSSYYKWGIPAASNFTVTGEVSGQSITATGSANAGQTMTIQTGSYTVTKDTSSPTYKVGVAGTAVTLGVLKLHASNEAITMNGIALQLTNTASSSASDLTKVYLYDGSYKVWEGLFLGSATTTYATLTAGDYDADGDYGVVVPKDSDLLLTVKADVDTIDVNTASTREGAFIAVDYDNDDQAGTTKGIGSTGSTSTNSSSSDTAVAGMRVFKSIPTVVDKTSKTSLTASADLYEVDITADSSGSIQLYRLKFSVATTGAVVKNWKLYGPNGAVNSSYIEVSGTSLTMNFDSSAADRIISAGATKRYRLQADSVTYSGTSGATDSLTLKLLGDSQYPSLSTRMGTQSQINADSSANDFIWSPQATTTVVAADIDWTNGYGVKYQYNSTVSTLTNDGTSHTFTFSN
ncbi:MAG: hypothetical protein GXP44_01760 [bacterium]|nr:hypothetical protein [bacterium]